MSRQEIRAKALQAHAKRRKAAASAQHWKWLRRRSARDEADFRELRKLIAEQQRATLQKAERGWSRPPSKSRLVGMIGPGAGAGAGTGAVSAGNGGSVSVSKVGDIALPKLPEVPEAAEADVIHEESSAGF